MLSGATPSAWAITGMAVFRMVVSSASMKKDTATSQGSRRVDPDAWEPAATPRALATRRVEGLQRGRIQLQLCGFEQVLELGHGGGAGDWSGDARLRQQPGDGDAALRGVLFLRDLVERG